MYRPREGNRTLKSHIIATLQNHEVKIYEALQWLDEYRNHPDVAVSTRLQTVFLYVILSMIAMVGLVLYIPSDPLSWYIATSVGGGVLIGVLATNLFMTTKFIVRHLRGICRVINIIQHVPREARSGSTLHTFFRTLSNAASRDKASAAKVMSLIY